MNCIFLGHRDSPEGIYEDLKNAIRILITSKNVSAFYMGNNGSFDYMCQRALSELSKEYDHISYTIILSRIDEIALNKEQEHTVFPEELEKVPYRFAISRRNDLLIKRGNIVVAFSKHKASNTYKLITKATKKGMRVINLCKDGI